MKRVDSWDIESAGEYGEVIRCVGDYTLEQAIEQIRAAAAAGWTKIVLTHREHNSRYREHGPQIHVEPGHPPVTAENS